MSQIQTANPLHTPQANNSDYKESNLSMSPPHESKANTYNKGSQYNYISPTLYTLMITNIVSQVDKVLLPLTSLSRKEYLSGLCLVSLNQSSKIPNIQYWSKL